MSSPLAGVAVVNSISFGVYGNVQRLMNHETLASHFWAGVAAGLAQSVVCSPIELVKTRQQLLPGSGGPLHCVGGVLRTEGLRGLFRGLASTALRDSPGCGVYFAAYELMTRGNEPASMLRVLTAGGLAGAVSWVVSYPVDVMKSRLQMDGANGTERRYRGLVDCFRQSVHTEGVSVLVRGMSSVLIRAFPTNAACFFVVTLVMRSAEAVGEEVPSPGAQLLTGAATISEGVLKDTFSWQWNAACSYAPNADLQKTCDSPSVEVPASQLQETPKANTDVTETKSNQTPNASSNKTGQVQSMLFNNGTAIVVQWKRTTSFSSWEIETNILFPPVKFIFASPQYNSN